MCGLLFWLGVEADFCGGAGVVGVVLVLVVLGAVEAVGAVGKGRSPGVGIGVGVACGNGGIGIGMLDMPDMQDDMPGMPGVMGVEDIGRGGGGMGIRGMGGIIGGIDEPITGANGLAEKMNETAGDKIASSLVANDFLDMANGCFHFYLDKATSSGSKCNPKI